MPRVTVPMGIDSMTKESLGNRYMCDFVHPAGYEEIRPDIAYIRPDIIHIRPDVGCHLLKYYVRPTLHPAVHEKARPDVTHIS